MGSGTSPALPSVGNLMLVTLAPDAKELSVGPSDAGHGANKLPVTT
jgi:hypothetical protein